MLWKRREKILKTLISDRTAEETMTKAKRKNMFYSATHHWDGTIDWVGVCLTILISIVTIGGSSIVITLFVVLFLELAQVL